MPAVADDSGIEAAALGGRPGVRSARYAGEDATDEENLAKLLAEVPDDGDRRRRVRVRAGVRRARRASRASSPSAARASWRRSRAATAASATTPRSCRPTRDDGRTMAELSVAEKDAISHRGRAARAFLDWLGDRA